MGVFLSGLVVEHKTTYIKAQPPGSFLPCWRSQTERRPESPALPPVWLSMSRHTAREKASRWWCLPGKSRRRPTVLSPCNQSLHSNRSWGNGCWRNTLPSMLKPWAWSPRLHRLGLVVHVHLPGTKKTEMEDWEFWIIYGGKDAVWNLCLQMPVPMWPFGGG